MKLKKVMLSIGVGVLAALFVGFLIEAIYPTPEYEAYCTRMFDAPVPQVAKTAECSYVYDTSYRNDCLTNNGMLRQDYDEQGCVVKETCDYCQRDYQEADKIYNRNLFYITAPIALLLIVLGIYLPVTIDAIASGSLLAGILTLLQITTRVFGSLGKWPRVILLGIELALVIWIGIKKVRDAPGRK